MELKKSYGELLVKLNKQCKLNEMVTKKNTNLHNDLIKLDVMLTRKDAESGKQSNKLDLTVETYWKLNIGSSKLEDILSLSYVGTSGLGFNKKSDTSNIVSIDGKRFDTSIIFSSVLN